MIDIDSVTSVSRKTAESWTARINLTNFYWEFTTNTTLNLQVI